jgi:hypothetical protein
MKFTIRLVTLMCTVAMLVSCILFPASADAVAGNEPFRLGRPDEMLSEIPQIAREAPGLEQLLFTLYGSNVSSLLSTYGTSKYFIKDDIPTNGYIFYVGKLSSTYYSEAGICYIASDGERTAVSRTTFKPDVVTTSSNYSPAKLRSDRKYYGYIKRASGTGTVSGYVQYYYLDPNS